MVDKGILLSAAQAVYLSLHWILQNICSLSSPDWPPVCEFQNPCLGRLAGFPSWVCPSPLPFQTMGSPLLSSILQIRETATHIFGCFPQKYGTENIPQKESSTHRPHSRGSGTVALSHSSHSEVYCFVDSGLAFVIYELMTNVMPGILSCVGPDVFLSSIFI